jgi:hypothetical protein
MLLGDRRPVRVIWLYAKNKGYRRAFRYIRWARDLGVQMCIELEEDRLEVCYDILCVCWGRHCGVDVCDCTSLP